MLTPNPQIFWDRVADLPVPTKQRAAHQFSASNDQSLWALSSPRDDFALDMLAVSNPLSALSPLRGMTAFAQNTSLDGDWLASLQTCGEVKHLTLQVTQEFSGSLAFPLEDIGRRDWN